MKKSNFLPGILLMAGLTLMSCRNENREADDLEDTEITPVTETETTIDNSFAQYDANRDDQWDENEFSESYQGNFSGYDSFDNDSSGELNTKEFYIATFRTIDRDGNQSINRQEWDEGYNNSFGDYSDEEDFDIFDTDQSGDLSESEWDQGFTKTTWFVTYDVDKNETVSNQEWTKANFSAWDTNNDGFLNEQEFQAYNKAMRADGNLRNSGNQNPETGNDPAGGDM